jgi:hypothetical protein
VESWLFEWFFFIFMDLSCRNIVFWCEGDFALGESLAKDKTEVGLELRKELVCYYLGRISRR